MAVQLGPAVPELPVGDLAAASDYYQRGLGLAEDWNYQGVLAGLSREGLRVILALRPAEEAGRGRMWINLESQEAVDALYAEWAERGARLSARPASQPWGLYEFAVEDLDGNRIRVFHEGVAASGDFHGQAG